jgi:Cu/Ag efflux protein CusF
MERGGGIKMRTRTISILATIAMLSLLSAARAEDRPDATLQLSGGSVAVGVGYSWASGTLTYKGKKYEVGVNGLSVGDVGVTKAEASGSVYHLAKLSDFDGNYTAAGAGATVAGGASASIMKNQNGVEIRLVSTNQGLKFTFAASGVAMKIKNPAGEPAGAPLTSGKLGGKVTATATVEDIDVEKRIVKLKDDKGEVTELTVPENVRNLAQVKKGDQVVATYYEALAYDVFKAGTEMPPTANVTASERAKKGEKPGAGVAEATTFSATIVGIDKPNSKVTLKGPEGNTETFKVRDPKKLDVVSVGDQVQITFTRALAISVKPAQAK